MGPLKAVSGRSIGVIVCLLAACAGTPGAMHAQSSMASSAPVFTSETRLVPVQVLVEDKSSRHPIEDLPENAFTVYDNGKPQKLAYFEHGQASKPLAIMLVIEIDANYFPKNYYTDLLPAALRRALQVLGPRDAVGLLVEPVSEYRGRPAPERFVVIQKPTPERQRVLDALGSLSEWIEVELSTGKRRDIHFSKEYDAGKTNIAALLSGADVLQSLDSQYRSVILSVSPDVFGTTHVRFFDRGIKQLANSDVTVSGLAPSPKGFFGSISKATNIYSEVEPTMRMYAVRHAAEVTGGEIVPVMNGDFATALAKAVEDLKAQYSLGFVPQSMDDKWHKMTVRITPPGNLGKRQMLIHARGGYRASTGTKAVPAPEAGTTTR